MITSPSTGRVLHLATLLGGALLLSATGCVRGHGAGEPATVAHSEPAEPEPEIEPERPIIRTEEAPYPRPAPPPEEEPPPPEPMALQIPPDLSATSWDGSGSTVVARSRPVSRPAGSKQVPPQRSQGFNPRPDSELSRQPVLIRALNPTYPPDAQSQRIQGAVHLSVAITAEGRVHGVRVLVEPGGGLGEAAMDALRAARFRPALNQASEPVDTEITYTVRFVLDGEEGVSPRGSSER